MSEPKGKTPSLLSMSTGKPTLHVCERSTKCSRCKKAVGQHENCFQIPKQKSGFTHKTIHCVSCMAKIVGQTRKDLEKVEELLRTG